MFIKGYWLFKVKGLDKVFLEWSKSAVSPR